ncbi:MAG: DUF2384 domain-containing protein [Saprospiraceae bacterium]|nr:DUF2384 domain-containing protein [Saprospiraceae bacterium]MBP7922660.1 DUF2384 domain-containing protein [Saprospiraceae bacterium]
MKEKQRIKSYINPSKIDPDRGLVAQDLSATYSPLPTVTDTPTLRVILGSKAISTELDSDSDLSLIFHTREGLTKDVLSSLSKFLGVTLEQLAILLHSSYRNLARKDGSDLLDSYKTEKVLEIATFAQRGVEVIGSHAGFKRWLQSPILALGGKAPLEFLDTSFGIQLLLKLLGRLEYGVYS